MSKRKKQIKTDNLTSILRDLINKEEQRLRREAEGYFFKHPDQKRVNVKTNTAGQFLRAMLEIGNFDKRQKSIIQQHIKNAIYKELSGHYNKNVITPKKAGNDIYFEIEMHNSNYIDNLTGNKTANEIGSTKKVPTSMRLDPILKANAQSYCKDNNTNLSALVDQLLRECLQAHGY